ncbi:PaaI family thioesterase [Myroides sp. mNGS23_01]|nr:PaaI family thioesterase [Myroides sp. mNGS23_01]WHT38545.1 PaaI family thioesterase [Myroides sp. mNGS23_01]
MTKNTRTYTWENPTTLLEEAKKQSGYDLLVGVLNGSLPQAPALETIHSTLIAVEKGQAVFELKASAFLYNLIGTVHGGIISTVLDTAIGCSLLTTLAAGESFTSLDLKVNFLKKSPPTAHYYIPKQLLFTKVEQQPIWNLNSLMQQV